MFRKCLIMIFILVIVFVVTLSAAKKTVAVVPFLGADGIKGLLDRMGGKFYDVLKKGNFKVLKQALVKLHIEKKNLVGISIMSPKELAGIGKELGVDYLIIGRLVKSIAVKKFRVAALLSGGMILYGTVVGEVKVIDVKKGTIIRNYQAEGRAKKQLLGAIQEKRYVLREAAIKAGIALGKKFVINRAIQAKN